MSVKWTEEQREAVYAPVSNILITAAAGAGKTQVLTGRILNRIIEGADITRMLVVTFTNAAAAEMKGRIMAALSDYLAEHPENAHIRNQLMCMPSASIQTIHSFCLDMIRNNFFKLNIKPDFKICDGAEGDMLCAEAMEMMLAQLYEEGGENFLAFADSFSNVYGDKNITEMVMELFKFSESMPHPERWLLEQRDIYETITEENFESSSCAVIIKEYVKRVLERGKDSLDGARKMCTAENGLEGYGAMLTRDIEAIDEVLSKENWDKMSTAASEFGFMARKSVKDCDEEIKEIVVATRDGVKKSIEDALELMVYSVSENVFLIKNNRKTVEGLIEATKCFKKHLENLKEEKNVLDFNDIEHFCIKLLEDDEISSERKKFYDEIYVDEYQDSNPSQEYIFRKISGDDIGKPNRFMVGDVKQSIYGFRHTSPRLFLEKKDTYKFGDEKNRKIVLGRNFRSSENIIDFINTVCEKIMCREIGGVDYDDEEKLVFQAPYPKKHTDAEIDVIYSDEKMDANGKIYAEANFIAAKIQKLVNETVYDVKTGEEKRVSYSDITVLMRSVRDAAPVFEKVFERYGIPIFVDSDAAYFDSTESKTILSLLTIIDNPLNDIPLISVMRSPVGGFDENELAEIKTAHKNENFYNDVKCEAEAGKYSEKCSEFLSMLEKMRKYSKYMPVNELLEKVIYETGYYDAVCAMAGADVRIENINQIVESARKYEDASYRGLYNFINYINSVKASGGKMGEAKVSCEGQNAVRVMSIHKSKGLEFPVVFLARCGKRMNTQNQNGALVLHTDCPIGLKYADAEKKIVYDTPLRQAAKIAIAQDELSEEIRILYVALTRAKERIIITGCVDKKDDAENKSKIDASALENGKFIEKHTYLEYFLAVAAFCGKVGKEGISVSYINADSTEMEQEEAEAEIEFSADTVKLIEENLSYEYGGGHLWEIPSKLTVTEMKRLQEHQVFDAQLLYTDIDMKVPVFMEEEKKSGAKLGQLIHFVMQNIDISLQSIAEVDNFVNSLVSKGILTMAEGETVDRKKISDFLSSDICALMRKADKIYREEPFAILVPASSVTGKSEDFSEQIMVQGIIDCYFMIGDEIYLLDYKTDRKCNREYIINHYKKQLEIYAFALEKKYFRKIFKKFIYLFNNNDIIEI